MRIADGYIIEFDAEMANTRRILELVPEALLDYQPHPKSMTMARLAGHIAEMGAWGTLTARLDSFDINPVDGPALEPYFAKKTADLLDFFDKGAAGAREAILELSDEAILKPWTLKRAGQELFTMPRIAVLRTMILSHRPSQSTARRLPAHQRHTNPRHVRSVRRRCPGKLAPAVARLASAFALDRQGRVAAKCGTGTLISTEPLSWPAP